jgi:hypothetical protein
MCIVLPYTVSGPWNSSWLCRFCVISSHVHQVVSYCRKLLWSYYLLIAKCSCQVSWRLINSFSSSNAHARTHKHTHRLAFFNLWRTESARIGMISIQNIEGKFVFPVRCTLAEDLLTVCTLWRIGYFQESSNNFLFCFELFSFKNERTFKFMFKYQK